MFDFISVEKKLYSCTNKETDKSDISSYHPIASKHSFNLLYRWYLLCRQNLLKDDGDNLEKKQTIINNENVPKLPSLLSSNEKIVVTNKYDRKMVRLNNASSNTTKIKSSNILH